MYLVHYFSSYTWVRFNGFHNPKRLFTKILSFTARAPNSSMLWGVSTEIRPRINVPSTFSLLFRTSQNSTIASLTITQNSPWSACPNSSTFSVYSPFLTFPVYSLLLLFPSIISITPFTHLELPHLVYCSKFVFILTNIKNEDSIILMSGSPFALFFYVLLNAFIKLITYR